MVTVKRKYTFEPDYAVAPGQTLAEVLASLGMSQAELAVRAGLTVQSINRIVKDAQPISFETANKLELVTGVPAKFWNNLEATYREQLARITEREQLEKDLQWLKTIPVKEIMSRKYIQGDGDKIEVFRQILQFYGVSSVEAWQEIWQSPAVAARRSQCFKSHPGATSAWIRMGEIQSAQIQCRPYDVGRFVLAVKKIRSLTLLPPEQFVPQMQEICADAGVALALVPELKKAPWFGASQWLTSEKAMILLGLRGKTDSQFWFSFFHEAGHVLNDKKKEIYINDGSSKDIREQKANEFAASLLIPSERQREVPCLRSRSQVVSFANEIGVAPGIVVGQFEYMTSKWGWFADLKKKLMWAA